MFVRVEGYVLTSPAQDTKPLKLFWNADRRDNFTTASPEGEQDALASDYQLVRTEGYVFNRP